MNSKLIDREKAIELRGEFLRQGKSVGLCHGTFDFIHLGHLRHFNEAASKVDILMCSITADELVIKGDGRPYYNELERLEYLSNLTMIDYCFVNNEQTSINLIKELKPNFYFKGIDYKNNEDDPTGNIGFEVESVESVGGVVHYTETSKRSSTEILNKYFKKELL
ncbi:putative ADP-heptose synthase [Halobacteriovorax marinus SJ]|uniref:ADP-heptose synthase n=1 Tax=Halobacteriovorax marinus (strain ATCC BAA-682 / DSM 15412 / SJ) TaxID=862908 RepID=E1WZX6_HALMS|nr:adenylyltransferase/cytidyltransferase family protein [Halobacteriovorax marinus]CBW27912.1 putative ADP-heptose synthase [Halobacteriovorax marinus SJ]